MTTYRVCFCFWRRFKPASEEPPQGIKEVFEEYSVQGTMGVEELQRFMVEVQGEAATATQEAVQDILDSAGEWRHLRVLHKRGLSVYQFFHYLFSKDNCPLSSSHGVICQDMNAPLSHYFMYTSHNSYLTGNQLTSAASDVPIIKALQRGLRVIELDLWPNSKEDDIDVRHGRTLTTPVELRKCLKSIKEHAFAVSTYPVIVTLEDHLTPDLQAKAAQMLTETFGSMLYIPSSESLKEFPSPEELKMRILISTKPPKKYLEPKKVLAETEHGGQEATEEDRWGGEVSYDKAAHSVKKMEREESEQHSSEEDEHHEEEEDEHRSYLNVAPDYKRLIAISVRKRKGDHSEWLKVDPHKVTRLSLSEQAFEKVANAHGPDLIRFTQKNLVRIFPKISRLSSSNYNPLLGWTYGAQMVALNMQGHGRPLWLMHGMFRANGGCGYVKKPDILLNTDRVFDPRNTFPVKKTLKVKVYMGDGWRLDFSQWHFDKTSPPDFYTRVGIAGVPADTVMKRTKAIEDHWTPVWQEEFVFPLTVPELALLRIEVHEYDMSEKDDFGGQTVLPVWELKPGIRCVPLCDHKGEPLPSVKLLMRFEFM